MKATMKKEPAPLAIPTSSFVIAPEIHHNILKRLFDIVFSLAVLVLGYPIFILIGLVVRMSSKGHVIYGHERIGRGGKPFKCYKFRTMYPDADQRIKELMAAHPEIKAEWDATHKLKNDPRITPIGKFLRKTSLDELPQFWNVLKGDLSVVGPRPVVRAEMERFYHTKASLILSVRPGLTGLWQVSGRSNTSYQERIRLDEEYIRNQSFLLDLFLIAKTIPSMLMRRGAY